jgi:Cof subfamily protein (haloacid dehalogenase superfamily)
LAYRLLVVDIDGTLLDSAREVTPEVCDVAALARDSGVRLTLATGRVYCSAVQVALALGVTEPIISDGGAVVGYPGGATLRDLRMAPGVAASILAHLAQDESDADCHLFYPHEIMVNRPSPAVSRYAERLCIVMTPVADLAAEALRRPVGPTMIVLRSTRERAPKLRAKYGALFGASVQVTSTAPHFLDFLHHAASKAQALDYLGQQLGIAREEIIAVGDGINDLDMIAHAGLGALVANASPELWPAADYVTTEPHCRGVAEVIRRFCQK